MERFIESKYLFESLRPYSLGVQICSVTTEQKSVAPLMCSSELDLKGSQIWPIARSGMYRRASDSSVFRVVD